MERKARFYDFLIGSANSKGIRYRDLALKGRHALHKKDREQNAEWDLNKKEHDQIQAWSHEFQTTSMTHKRIRIQNRANK